MIRGKEACPVCSGTGKIEDTSRVVRKCGECNGTGKK